MPRPAVFGMTRESPSPSPGTCSNGPSRWTRQPPNCLVPRTVAAGIDCKMVGHSAASAGELKVWPPTATFGQGTQGPADGDQSTQTASPEIKQLGSGLAA